MEKGIFLNESGHKNEEFNNLFVCQSEINNSNDSWILSVTCKKSFELLL